MKKLSLRTLTVAALLTCSFSNIAADLDVGIFQLNRGNFNAALAEFEPLAEEGYAPAQYQLGLMHQNGYGRMKKDLNKAIELFTLAAAQNDLDALFSLSVLYSEGEGVEKDLQKAFELTEKAAEKHLPRAQFNLGVMYYNGNGIQRNLKKAVQWYELAANQNYTLAQFNLALMYFEGEGVRQSTENSYLWNIIAAKNGYTPAYKSSQMDEQKLNSKQIESIRARADEKRAQILAKIDRKNRLIEQEFKRRQYNP